MFGINEGEFIVIVVVALLLLGPERLPEYARQFRQWVIRARDVVRDGQGKVSQELGHDVNWRSLDPRQYDPRFIVRDAMFGNDSFGDQVPLVGEQETQPRHRPYRARTDVPAPVDTDAT